MDYSDVIYLETYSEHERCEETGKRIFTSKNHARNAMISASFRYRVYPCEFCSKYHVTNQDKYKD